MILFLFSHQSSRPCIGVTLKHLKGGSENIRYQHFVPFPVQFVFNYFSDLSDKTGVNLRKMNEKKNTILFSFFSIGNCRPAKADFVLRGRLTFPQPFSQRYLSPRLEIPPHFFTPIFFIFPKREMFWWVLVLVLVDRLSSPNKL